jgi:hypothetical protein
MHHSPPVRYLIVGRLNPFAVCLTASRAATVSPFAWVQVAPDAPEIVAGIQRLAECLDKVERFGDRAASMSSGSPMSTNTHTSGRM